jgi:pimeloyl-ACP methyl ester carboxylesterase/class 3 adenylate cyclase
MEQDIRFCRTADGIRIAFAVAGEGPPLLMPPSWTPHLELDWEEPSSRGFIQRLARNHTLIRYDRRGCGLSDRDWDGDLDVDTIVLDMEAVADHLGLETFTTVGTSLGGMMSLAYAIRHPERIERLVLLGTGGHGDDIIAPDFQEAMVALVRANWGVASRTLADMFIPNAEDRDVLINSMARRQREASSPELAARTLQLVFSFDIRAELGRIMAPTLVIHARDDQTIPARLGRELAAAIPNARLVMIDSKNHDPVSQQDIETIAEAIERFTLGSTPARPVPETDIPFITPASGLVTILMTDLESSTLLTQHLGDEGAQQIIRGHNQTVRRAILDHGGREVKHMGDGIMASFPSATRAVGAALQVQQELAGAEVRVRIGLNAGEPIVEDDDLFGTAVQLTARICGSAEPGQIVVSNVVRELVAGKGFRFEPIGPVQLKGFSDPVSLYSVEQRVLS